jgi:hypothetical protein
VARLVTEVESKVSSYSWPEFTHIGNLKWVLSYENFLSRSSISSIDVSSSYWSFRNYK